MGLSVGFGTVKNYDGPASWYVNMQPCNLSIAGFGRKQDAEIAMQFMQTLAIDWSAEKVEIFRQTGALGLCGHKPMLKAIAQHLQW